MSRVFVGSVALVITLVSGGAARAEQAFEKFKSAEARFSVEMPGKPEHTNHETPSGLVVHYFRFKSFIEAYQVHYVDFPESVVRGGEPRKLFKVYTSSEYPNKTLEGEKHIAFGTDMIPCLEYRIETTLVTDNGAKAPVFIRERLLLAGNRLYVIRYRAVLNENLLDSKEANRFFDSFEITK
jgi:hypothetical protein